MEPGIDAMMEAERDSPTTPRSQPAELAVNSHVTERVSSLDVLRGLMALSVAVYHLHTWTLVFGRGTKLSSSVAVLGLFSVQGFFIVSGFAFYHLYRRVRFDLPELGRFHVRRFLRIAPLYYVAVFLNLALAQPVAGTFSWPRLGENLSLTFGLVHPNHSWVLGGWSIGIEYVFYLVFPLLVFVTRRALVLYMSTAALVLVALWFTFQVVATTPELQRFNAYVRIPNHAFLFLLGGVVCDLRARTAYRVPPVGLALGLVVLLGGGWLRQAAFYDHFEAVLGWARAEHLLQVGLLTLLFAFARPGQSRWQKAFTWLGDLSYSVYLLHPFAYLLFTSVVPDAPAWPRFLAGLALTLLLSAASYRWLERPMIELGKRLTRKPR